MSDSAENEFLCGVVEGFYGRPWTFAQRHRLLGWLKESGLNTYCFAPKDDPKHRVLWRELLEEAERSDFEKLIEDCAAQGVRFIYGIAPGWTDHFSDLVARFDPHELLPDLKRRCEQLLEIGCRAYALQFDDVPHLNREQHHRLAVWHAETANALYEWLVDVDPASRLILCPAVYCSAMANGPVDDSPYLDGLGSTLERGVPVFWTGPDVISREINADHLRRMGALLNRPPVLWDNLHANDYDPARIHLGPFTGRTSQLRKLSGGVLLNPNIQFELNRVPLHTLGAFLDSPHLTPGTDPEAELSAALRAWMPDWDRLVGEAFDPELVRLVIDCFHTPFRIGAGADVLLSEARQALNGDTAARRQLRERTDRLAKLFFDLGTLKNRDLLDALWSPVWRLKDELELVLQISERTGPGPHPLPEFPTAITRGGLVAQLRDLVRTTDGGYQVQQ